MWREIDSKLLTKAQRGNFGVYEKDLRVKCLLVEFEQDIYTHEYIDIDMSICVSKL